MKVVNSILELIGNTPLMRLNRVTNSCGASILAKLEFLNPTGSIKDRIALSMIEAAEEEGIIKPCSTIIEATSGNTRALWPYAGSALKGGISWERRY